jgi:hypothetical protein
MHLFNGVSCVLLLLRYMLYASCSVYFFSSCPLTTVTYPEWEFSVFFLRCKINAKVLLAKTGQGLHTPSELIVLYYVLFVCKCVLCYCHQVSTKLQLTNISTYKHTPLKSNQNPTVFLPTLRFNSCPKTARIRRSVKWIYTRKPKSKRRKICTEIFR